MPQYDVILGYPAGFSPRVAKLVHAYLRKKGESGLGSTYFRGTNLSTQQALDMLNSPTHKLYRQLMRDRLKHPRYGGTLKFNGESPTLGMWVDEHGKVFPEPSLLLSIKSDNPDHLRHYASYAGNKANQDAVLLFEHDKKGKGNKVDLTLPPHIDVNQLVSFLHSHGIQTCSYHPGIHTLTIIYGEKDKDLIPKVEALCGTLGKRGAKRGDTKGTPTMIYHPRTGEQVHYGRFLVK